MIAPISDSETSSKPEAHLPRHLLVFSLRNAVFTAVEIIQAAFLRGDLQPIWKDFLGLVEMERQASERGSEPDIDVLQTMSEEFRYARDLVTAEETERWLAARGLTMEDFNDHLVRQYWRQHSQINGPAEKPDYECAPSELQNLLCVELLLSGKLEEMARRLSWRVAVSQEVEATPGDWLEAEWKRFYERTSLDAARLPRWLERLGRERVWLEEQIRMEAIYQRRCDELLTPGARAKQLSLLRLPLMRFEIERIDFESRDAGEEAFLCLTEDGLPMAELAGQARYPIQQNSACMEDLPSEWQQLFLSASPGQVLEPLELNNRIQVCRVIRKIEPDLEDDVVRERVDRMIIESHFTELAARHVRWLIGGDAS